LKKAIVRFLHDEDGLCKFNSMNGQRVKLGEKSYNRSPSGRYTTTAATATASGSGGAPTAGLTVELEDFSFSASHGRSLFHSAVSIDETPWASNPTSSKTLTREKADLSANIVACFRRKDLLSFYEQYNPNLCKRVDEILTQEVSADKWLESCFQKYNAIPTITYQTKQQIVDQLGRVPKKKSLFAQTLDTYFQKGHESFQDARRELQHAAEKVRRRAHSHPHTKGLAASKGSGTSEGGELLVGWGNQSVNCIPARSTECLGKSVFDCLHGFNGGHSEEVVQQRKQENGQSNSDESLQAALAAYYHQDFVNTIVRWKRANPRHEGNYERFLYDKFPENIATTEKTKQQQQAAIVRLPSVAEQGGSEEQYEDEEEEEEEEERAMRELVEESRRRCEQELEGSMRGFIESSLTDDNGSSVVVTTSSYLYSNYVLLAHFEHSATLQQ
jgi:hypothetical protein